MKPSPWAEAAVAALLLTGQASAQGFGPVSLQMSRPVAIAAAGPGALVGPLCGGAEGVLFPTPQGEAMAMFERGQVSEMALTPAGDGAERPRAVCAARATSLLPPGPARHSTTETAGIVEDVSRIATPRGTLAAVSRWSQRSGACYVTLHWLAPDTQSLLLPGG